MLTAGVRPCAVVAFSILLDAILAGSVDGPDIRAPLCPVLGEDESKILQLIGLVQQRFGEVHAVLGRWLSPLDQGVMISPAAHVAIACAQKGLRVPWRRSDTTIPAYLESASGNSGISYIH